MKRRNDLKKMCISSLTPEFPEDCKFYPADTKDELHKVTYCQSVESIANFPSECSLVKSNRFNFYELINYLLFHCSLCGFLGSKGSRSLTGEINGLMFLLIRCFVYYLSCL